MWFMLGIWGDLIIRRKILNEIKKDFLIIYIGFIIMR